MTACINRNNICRQKSTTEGGLRLLKESGEDDVFSVSVKEAVSVEYAPFAVGSSLPDGGI